MKKLYLLFIFFLVLIHLIDIIYRMPLNDIVVIWLIIPRPIGNYTDNTQLKEISFPVKGRQWGWPSWRLWKRNLNFYWWISVICHCSATNYLKLTQPHNNDADDDDEHEDDDDDGWRRWWQEQQWPSCRLWNMNLNFYWWITVICHCSATNYLKLAQPHNNDADDNDEHKDNNNNDHDDHDDHDDNDNDPHADCGTEI